MAKGKTARAHVNRRRAFFRRVKPGSPPGTLVAQDDAAASRLRLMIYDSHACSEIDATLDDLRQHVDGEGFLWLAVEGLADVDLVHEIGRIFDIHRLSLEDVINGNQRAKTEPYDSYYFIIAQLPQSDAEEFHSAQLSLFFGRKFVVTFHEGPEERFEPVRERIRQGRVMIRSSGPSYLAYALLDAAIDSYFPALEECGDRLDELEEKVLADVDTVEISDLHAMKRRLAGLRRVVWPHREAFSKLLREESPLISDATQLHMRDCVDHAAQVMDMVESYRDVSFGLVELYLSSMSARMNEVMKVLTIIATIFIPLSFVAGLYGMNFNVETSPWNMPELAWYWGYPAALGLMALIAGGLIVFFKRRGWLG